MSCNRITGPLWGNPPVTCGVVCQWTTNALLWYFIWRKPELVVGNINVKYANVTQQLTWICITIYPTSVYLIHIKWPWENYISGVAVHSWPVMFVFTIFTTVCGGDLCCVYRRDGNLASDSPWWHHQMKRLPRYWPFVRGIHRPSVNSPHKGQWRRALMFSLMCIWTNGWINNWDASD